MVLSLIFGRKYARSSVGGVVLDATVSEDHSFSSRVTNFPVEGGRIISDHIINDPDRLTITGIVTDTPLSIFPSFNRSIEAFNQLINIHRRRERISVVTGINIYTDMVMTSFQVPRNIQSGQSLSFVIELQKVIIDNNVTLNFNPNDPFNRSQDFIPREIIAETNAYPALINDPPTSLKDQASSEINAGIQDLFPVPTTAIANLITATNLLSGVI